MDWNKAIEYAELVGETYKVDPANLSNRAGMKLVAGGRPYTVLSSIYAFDLATDMNPDRGDQQVSIGLICLADGTGEVAIAVRGTEGIAEWVHDADFLHVTCPIVPGSGHTEDGFTAMYSSLRTEPTPGSPTVAKALATLLATITVATMTICGHSLGGALATLLALDVAANTAYSNPTTYTYASPRVGDPNFVDTFNQLVKNTYRIANRIDIVPKLPLPPYYEHVDALVDLNPVRLLPIRSRVLVKLELGCLHAINTYLYLLSLNAGGAVLPLDAACVPGT